MYLQSLVGPAIMTAEKISLEGRGHDSISISYTKPEASYWDYILWLPRNNHNIISKQNTRGNTEVNPGCFICPLIKHIGYLNFFLPFFVLWNHNASIIWGHNTNSILHNLNLLGPAHDCQCLLSHLCPPQPFHRGLSSHRNYSSSDCRSNNCRVLYSNVFDTLLLYTLTEQPLSFSLSFAWVLIMSMRSWILGGRRPCCYNT